MHLQYHTIEISLYENYSQNAKVGFVKLNICVIKPESANPRPMGRMCPFKLFSAALLLPLKIDNLEENQQIQ
jgi:hypothetical protein